ncbi:hypothetical protein X975_14863, partial [Stegodyphus mimosarum]
HLSGIFLSALGLNTREILESINSKQNALSIKIWAGSRYCSCSFRYCELCL